MAAENIKELLGSLSVAKLRTMDEALDRQIAERKTEKSWIADALAKKGAAPKSSRADSPPRKPQKARAGGRNTGSAAAIRQVISAEPDRVWMPAEVIDAVLMQGVRSTPSSIRVALRRMGDKGFLERGPDGTGWTLAKSNGSQQGSLDEQTSQTSHPNGSPPGGGENVG